MLVKLEVGALPLRSPAPATGPPAVVIRSAPILFIAIGPGELSFGEVVDAADKSAKESTKAAPGREHHAVPAA